MAVFGPVFPFQPSEFAKVAVIIFLAHEVTKNSADMGKMRVMLKIMGMILPIVGLVGASNLSTAIIILGIAAVLIFTASPRYGQFVILGLAARRISGRLSGAGKLPAGADRHLERSGGL